ncbi:MAG: HupE / UreJ protein [Flavobacteriales bacterium CG_4_9_14_3_um_filter_40_17]|nr:MAG: HupE / UreJ protein [Flavobacteriales bacterium CG_4_9_14_3_um_filter_40_17]
MDQFIFYAKLGLFHVLDIHAYDHILFLVVMTVPYVFKDWKRILTLVSIFTVGHTLSLILSVYGVVRINANLVEFLIPITILISALYNLFTAGKISKGERVGVLFFAALFFGLIHGLGFASHFKAIVGSGGKLLPLLEFAVGIEGAQLIIVLVVLILSFLIQTVFRFSKRDWVLVTSSMVIGIVILMLRDHWLW